MSARGPHLVAFAVLAGCTTNAWVLDRPTQADGGLGPSPDVGVREVSFERRVLETEFISEGITAGDVDEDGAVDIVTYPFWWSGPAFTARHELGPPRTTPLDPTTEFSSVYGVFLWDVDADGCLDAVVAPRESDPRMIWYRSPRRPSDSRCADPDQHWAPFDVVGPGLDATIENPIVVELVPGEPVLLMGEGVSQTLAWWAPGDDPTAPWLLHPVSEPRFEGALAWSHGMGVGDLDSDGRRDVLTPRAWFEQVDPESFVTHSFGSAPGDVPAGACSRMWTFDVDADGFADVICARPHDYGLSWWRQGPATEGDPVFTPLTISTHVSQMHGIELADLDLDGIPEIVTGKRWYANLEGDPGLGDPPLLVYYSIERTAPGVRFVEHVIDEDVGVGAQFAVTDLDADGRPDIVVSSKRGVSYFLQR